jgi:outer membrane PBP1 activator LpoA protein
MRGGLIVVAAALLLAGCGQVAPSPVDPVQTYATALGQGNYARACSLLDARARIALQRLVQARHDGHDGRRAASCAGVFRRCLPVQVTNARHDQTQLLFATVEIARVARGRATATLGGTAVARAVRVVRVIRGRRGTWRLDSYGSGLRDCARARSRH